MNLNLKSNRKAYFKTLPETVYSPSSFQAKQRKISTHIIQFSFSFSTFTSEAAAIFFILHAQLFTVRFINLVFMPCTPVAHMSREEDL